MVAVLEAMTFIGNNICPDHGCLVMPMEEYWRDIPKYKGFNAVCPNGMHGLTTVKNKHTDTDIEPPSNIGNTNFDFKVEASGE